MAEVRLLRPGDEAALEAFLVAHADSSMFLRSNARAAGLVDGGQPLQATYVAALEDGRALRTLGLVVPPPYLQGFAGRHLSLVATLRRVEDAVGAWPGVRASGDHFLIVMRKEA